MRILASNDDAALIQSGREYWYIKNKVDPLLGTWGYYAINERSETYNATNALKYFEEVCGKATFVRKDLYRF